MLTCLLIPPEKTVLCADRRAERGIAGNAGNVFSERVSPWSHSSAACLWGEFDVGWIFLKVP